MGVFLFAKNVSAGRNDAEKIKKTLRKKNKQKNRPKKIEYNLVF